MRYMVIFMTTLSLGPWAHGTRQKPPTPKPTAEVCDEVLALAKAASPLSEESLELIKKKRELELALVSEVEADYRLVRQTDVKGRQQWERLIFLLARGEYEEVLLMLRPHVYQLTDQYYELIDLAKNIQTAASESVPNAETLFSLRRQYETASASFGIVYGTYKVLWSTLESVKAGNGLKELEELPLVASGQGKLVFDLTSPVAQSTARRVLSILNVESERRWVPNVVGSAMDRPQPTLAEVQTLFRNNIYALIAMLSRDLEEQKRSQKSWVRVMHNVANFYLNLTSYEFIPERYRKVLLKMAGIAYDQLMLERHLDKIQAIVSVARAKTETGNLMINTSADIMDLQIRTLLEYDAVSVGDDLFITFARIGYHTDVWTNVVVAIESKAKGYASVSSSPDEDQEEDLEIERQTEKPTKKVKKKSNSPKRGDPNQYAHLLKRVRTAEVRAQDLGPLPYAYNPSVSHELRLALTQLGYLVATEEGVRHFAWPWIQSLLGLF